ncbi:3'-5' exonuclease [Escherichia coli]|uniref:3'-5' exonuclease n=1 Tax=Escherichia coli TaxID=562 RepID=UPI003890B2C2
MRHWKRARGRRIPQDAVQLMTLHSAKGLEFPWWVFIVGMEEGMSARCRWMKVGVWKQRTPRPAYVGVNPRDAETDADLRGNPPSVAKKFTIARRALSASCRKSVWKRYACATVSCPVSHQLMGKYADGRERQRLQARPAYATLSLVKAPLSIWKAAVSI